MIFRAFHLPSQARRITGERFHGGGFLGSRRNVPLSPIYFAALEAPASARGGVSALFQLAVLVAALAYRLVSADWR